MSDTLVRRVMRLVSGSVNSLVDAVEGSAPDTVLQEAIREVEGAIGELRDKLGVVIANKHHAAKRLMEANAKHEDLAGKLQFAVSERRDDLAEAAISRQLDLEAQMPVLEEALKAAADEEVELEGYISALVGRRHEMEADLKAFKDSRIAGSQSDAPAITGNAAEKRVESAEAAFNRVLRGATGVGSSILTDRNAVAKLAELEHLSRENRIKERLAAVKSAKPSSQ